MADLTNLGLAANKRLRQGALEYGASTAMNNFSRMLSQQRGQRNLQDFTTGSNKNLQKLNTAYSQRGLRNSGIRKQGVTDFAKDATQQRQDIVDQSRNEQTQFDMNDANYRAAWDALQKEVELDKTGSINNLFAELSKYYPFLGS